MGAPFIHRLRVRYSECDQQNIVFNANYFTYFDVALTELWREAIGPYAETTADGTDMVVAEATARYRAPARFDDEVDVTVAVTRLGTTAMTTHMEVRREGELLVEGEMRHVFVDPAGGGKVPMPDSIRHALEPYLTAGAAEAAPAA